MPQATRRTDLRLSSHPRAGRWRSAFIVISQLATVFYSFVDILLRSSWPGCSPSSSARSSRGSASIVPRLPRVVATVIVVYRPIVAVLVVIIILVAGRAGHLDRRVRGVDPGLDQDLPSVASSRGRTGSTRSGSARSTSSPRPRRILANLDDLGRRPRPPLQQIAVASVERRRHDADRRSSCRSTWSSIATQILAFLFRLVPPALRRGGTPPADVGLALVRRVPARPVGHGPRVLPRRARDEPRLRPARSRPLTRRDGRHPPGDPVLRTLRVLDAAGASWRCLFKPDAVLPVTILMAHRLVRRHERPAAADHAGRRRHPSDRRPWVGAHRLARSRASPARSSASRSPRSSRPSSSTSSIATTGDRTVAGRAARRLSERDGRPVHVPRDPDARQRRRRRRSRRPSRPDRREDGLWLRTPETTAATEGTPP